MAYKLGNFDLEDHSRDFPDDFDKVPLVDKRIIVIHHTATNPDMTLQALYNAHRDYGGIGYNALVYPSGRAVYVGDWNTSRAGVGQIGTVNYHAYHVALVGDFTFDAPRVDALHACHELLANLMMARGLVLPVVPHCLFNVDEDAKRSKWNTACPGNTWPYWWGWMVV